MGDTAEAFLSWFEAQGASVDRTALTLADIPGFGRGVVALRDLPAEHTLFTIPRTLALSMRTSALPALFGEKAWKDAGLYEGWAGLILCMLWEAAQGAASRWHGFFPILPERFDTPMFWRDEELAELKGTAVLDKIGKEDAERDFTSKILPAVESRPDLFPEKERYTLERYHMMGSCVLSRSFHVLRWKKDEEADEEREVEEGEAGEALGEGEGAMDVDEPAAQAHEEKEEKEDEDDEDDEDGRYEDPADVAMVPMADMLNGRFATETARLYYDDEHVLKMMTTQPIAAGDQIWNTYGDPPNSDLLRRYGFVDVTELKAPLAGAGNPADIVEVPANLVVEAAAKHTKNKTQERVHWWLEEAEDDVFVIGTDCELPEELVSLARLLLQNKADWEKTKAKGKVPKPAMDATIGAIAIDVLQTRLKEYATTVEEDEKILADSAGLGLNLKMAVTVRLGEKRILEGTLKELQKEYGKEAGKRKRSADGVAARGKKARR